MSLISTAVTPVVLISAVAILLSGYTAKQTSISSQMRDLAAEHRNPATSDARRVSLKIQLALFQHRLTAVWASVLALTLALICFLTMIVSVILEQRTARLGSVGAGCLMLGLLLIFTAVAIELYEIHLSRLTARQELADICGMPEA